MRIRAGYEMTYFCPQETPMILTVSIHYSRASDVITPDYLTSDPAVPIAGYRDGFGNWCTRIVAPPGRIRIRGDGVVTASMTPDVSFAVSMTSLESLANFFCGGFLLVSSED